MDDKRSGSEASRRIMAGESHRFFLNPYEDMAFNQVPEVREQDEGVMLGIVIVVRKRLTDQAGGSE